MSNMKHEIKILVSSTVYQYYYLLMQLAFLSGVIAILFDGLWSSTVFLPLSVGIEVLVKFIITHVIEHFIHHQ